MLPRQQGVALVITLIMLAVITFMAVTFLAVSRREAGSVRVITDQTKARFLSEAALEIVKAELTARILGTANAYNYDLMVSTNYLSPVGYYDNSPAVQTVGIPNVTNVSYQYPNGTPLTGNDALQNLANLWYNARAPVFITNRFFASSNEFRFYLDLNRNRRHDTNGFLPVISPNNLLYDTNGNSPPLPGVQIASNYFIGDPEWIGILERPDRPHSSTNRFVARYAYIVIPSGKTLDVNYIHNQAKQLNPNADGFFRNQGVGPWELNMAGFLVDLNTNYWQSDLRYGSPYFYDSRPPPAPNATTGAAFDDALSFVRFRYAGNYRSVLKNVFNEFGSPGADAFRTDFYDGYSGGPLMTNYWGLNVAFDPDTPRVNSANSKWPGGDSLNQFFTMQDFFDRKKAAYPGTAAPFSPWAFPDRLWSAGTNISSYDRYTYYRMLAQLGTDSTPNPPDKGKIHLNYKNTGGVEATNFVAWIAEDFFTNTAHKLLIQYTKEWTNANPANFLALYGLKNQFGLTNIPVLVSNNFVYRPAIHRLLQLAANIADAQTNRANFYGGADLPSVFRPIFRKQGNDVFITGYVESGSGTNYLTRPRDLNNPADVAALQPNDNVYGVPWVIGAKKGLPNFNEIAMQTVFQITRKLEVRRGSLSTPQPLWRTNLMYVLSVTNVIGVEAWNSYRTNLNRDVDIIVADDMAMVLTNNYGLRKTVNATLPGLISVRAGLQAWRGFKAGETNSFLIPLRTNVVFLPDSAYVFSAHDFTTNWNVAWDTSQTFAQPQWGLAATNRLRFIMVDKLANRVIDFVQLDGLNGMRDLSAEIKDPDGEVGFGGLWSTNLLGGRLPQGIKNQIDVSLGIDGAGGADWSGYGLNQPGGTTKDYEIDYFRAMYGFSPYRFPGLVNTNTIQQVPFTPTKRISQYLTWQANDPLVHYTRDDLTYLAIADSVRKESLKTAVQAIPNIGQVNDRYQPWGGNPNQATDPNKFNVALKDPGVASSDDWQFPTNKFPNIGWLGRVHRGTPWQTVYMKAADVDTNTAPTALNQWQGWTGNKDYGDAMLNRPMNDRILFDVFTTAFNENAARGQLSVNQSGLAAWSALFSGVVAFTNNFPNSALPVTNYALIQPAGLYDPVNTNTWPPLVRMVAGINRERARGFFIGTNFVYAHRGGSFQHVGDIFSVPELTDASPYLNVNRNSDSFKKGLNDAVYEWLPQQVMGLLRAGEPRFVIYAYGQTLRPAPASIVTASGPFNGMCTNYQITAEVATRAVLRIEDAPTGTTTTKPRVVIENFNLLPPD